jgi:hypothetical protein
MKNIPGDKRIHQVTKEIKGKESVCVYVKCWSAKKSQKRGRDGGLKGTHSTPFIVLFSLKQQQVKTMLQAVRNYAGIKKMK